MLIKRNPEEFFLKKDLLELSCSAISMNESDALIMVGLLIAASPLLFLDDLGVAASGLSNGDMESSESFPWPELELRNLIGLKELARSPLIIGK